MKGHTPIETITERGEAISKLHSENTELWAVLWLMFFMLTVLFITAVLQRVEINELRAENKQLESYKKYKCDWEDFNRSFIPETALPRLPKTEAMIKEMK